MSLLPSSGQIVLYDTEFTSWQDFMAQGFKAPGRYPEVIQIGAVRIDVSDDFAERDVLDILVLPRVNAQLSDYIIDLTGITQVRLNEEAIRFSEALESFLEFVGDYDLYSFGTDGKIMTENCKINDLPIPSVFEQEKNLKIMLAEAGLIDGDVMSSELPSYVGLPPEPNAHDALADARAVVRVLRYLRSEGRLA